MTEEKGKEHLFRFMSVVSRLLLWFIDHKCLNADSVLTVVSPQHLSATSCQAEGRYGHWVYNEKASPGILRFSR